MSIAVQLKIAATEFFRREATAFQLDASALRVSYVLNWGGFINHSFQVSDGRTRLHLKLATSTAAQNALRRWYQHSAILQKYHAPRVLSWIDLDGASGLLFPQVDGITPGLTDDVVCEVTQVLERLHDDRELRAALMPNDTPIAAETYFDIYHARFVADLDLIRAYRPDFMTDAVLEFMEHEVAVLAERVRSSAEFQEPLDTPIHGDLWLNNILWHNRDSWHLLDWDDMCIGDPAIDIAMLTGPTPDDLAPLKRVDQLPIALSDSQRERLLLYGRAALLDWIIDPVADWIEAAAAPALESEIRGEKERMHRMALEAYGMPRR